MNMRRRLRMALQKSGRLSDRSLSLLEKCGLKFEWSKDRLFSKCENFPLDLMLVRDDDIPEYVLDGVCDLGIVGYNVLQERLLSRENGALDQVTILKRLNFGQCRLCIAVPKDRPYGGTVDLTGQRIATSYPETTGRFLKDRGITAKIVEMSGSVEIAPTLGIADAVCDLVSTGATLHSNGLKEVEIVLESQSVLIEGKSPANVAGDSTERLLQRIQGVIKAEQTKYIMMNAPRTALEAIRKVIPGMEEPSIIPLASDGSRVAIHAVAREHLFWETMEQLKAAGASSILVVPIEKIVE